MFRVTGGQWCLFVLAMLQWRLLWIILCASCGGAWQLELVAGGECVGTNHVGVSCGYCMWCGMPPVLGIGMVHGKGARILGGRWRRYKQWHSMHTMSPSLGLARVGDV